MMRKAMSVPATGEMTMAARIFEMPFHFRSPNPREATTAPMIPPMIACEEEEGIPECHVSRSQKIAPPRAERTTTWVTSCGSTIPCPTVVATCVETSAPTTFSPAAMMKPARRVGEECGVRIAAPPVRLVLQGVRLHAVLECLAHLRGQVLDPAVQRPGRFHDEKPKLLGMGGGAGHLVEVDPGGGPVDQVDDVVDRGGEGQDVLPVDRCDEGRVQLPDYLMGDGVPLVLDLLDQPRFLPDVLERVQKLLEGLGALAGGLRRLLAHGGKCLIAGKDPKHGTISSPEVCLFGWAWSQTISD